MNTTCLETMANAAFFSAINDENDIKSETYRYISDILYPLFSELDKINSFKLIKQWKKKFPKEFFNINYVKYDSLYPKRDDDIDEQKINLKYIIFKNIGLKSALVLKEWMDTFDPFFISPWDAKKAIQNMDIIKIDKSKKLDIVLVVEGRKFKHHLTDEFVCGILLFSKISKYEIGAFLDLKNIDKDTKIDFSTSKFDYKPKNKTTYYILTVDKEIYYFETPAFIQGIITGQKWSKNKNHDFSKIIQITPEGSYPIIVE